MIGQLFGPELRLAFLVCLMLNLANEFTGASFFGYYSTDIFNELGLDGGLWTGISGWIVLGSCVFGLSMVEKTGRLPILMIGVFLQMMSFYVMAFTFYYKWAYACVGTFLFWNFFSYGGLYIVYYAYICETVPPIAVGIGFTFQYGIRTI
jgi:Na+/melibiose symporter-like transporter